MFKEPEEITQKPELLTSDETMNEAEVDAFEIAFTSWYTEIAVEQILTRDGEEVMALKAKLEQCFNREIINTIGNSLQDALADFCEQHYLPKRYVITDADVIKSAIYLQIKDALAVAA